MTLWYLSILVVSFYLCESQRVSIRLNDRAGIDSNVNEIRTYLEETIFCVYLEFMHTSHRWNSTNSNETIQLDISDLIPSNNHWVIYKIFNIIRSKTDLSATFRLDVESKLSLTRMNTKQWQIFVETCNILGFYGADSKTDIWSFIEFFRLPIPDQLILVIRHNAVTSMDHLPDRYTPLNHNANVKIYADQLWANKHKVASEWANNTQLLMLSMDHIKGQIATGYEAVLCRNTREYNDPELCETVHEYAILGIKDRIYEDAVMVYGWTADTTKGIMQYLMQTRHINDVLEYLYVPFFRNIVDRYGFDLNISSYKFGLDSRGLMAEFEFLRNTSYAIQ
eukprot:435862_1